MRSLFCWSSTVHQSTRLLLLLLLSMIASPVAADIVVPGRPGSEDAIKIQGKAERAIREGSFDEAHQILVDLKSEPDQFHPELVFVELLFRQGFDARAKSALESFSATSGPRFDLFLACAKLAIREGRWFDAFVHTQLADNQPMPESWTDDFRQTNKVELDRLRIKSVAMRGNWPHVQELVAPYVKNEQGDLLQSDAQQVQLIDPEILEFAAQAEFHTGNPRDAFGLYRLLATIRQDGSDPVISMAKLYEAKDDHERAEKLYQRAAETKPLNARSVLEYARWLIWRNRTDEAQEQLSRLDSVVEFSRERDYLQALVYRQSQQAVRAQEILQKLYEVDPTSFAFGNQLALTLIESSETEEQKRALEIAQQNVGQFRSNLEAWATLGWIQLNLGQVEDAQRSLAVAVQSGQVSRDTAYFLSQLKQQQGDREAAQKLLRQAEQAEGPFFYAGK